MYFFLHFLGELELPEELPEFPYESEFIQEIENAILKYGGQEGCTLLKEHAIEQRENLESSLNQNLSGKGTINEIHNFHTSKKYHFQFVFQNVLEVEMAWTIVQIPWNS